MYSHRLSSQHFAESLSNDYKRLALPKDEELACLTKKFALPQNAYIILGSKGFLKPGLQYVCERSRYLALFGILVCVCACARDRVCVCA